MSMKTYRFQDLLNRRFTGEELFYDCADVAPQLERVAALESAAVASALRVKELEKALSALVDAHDGYRQGMGPCICAAHGKARALMETATK
jgi:hypothetical protein